MSHRLADNADSEGNWKYIRLHKWKTPPYSPHIIKLNYMNFPVEEKPTRKQIRKVMSNLTQEKLHVN